MGSHGGRGGRMGAGKSMYEYKVENIPQASEVREERINQLSADGWEFVNSEPCPGNRSICTFRRPRATASQNPNKAEYLKHK